MQAQLLTKETAQDEIPGLTVGKEIFHNSKRNMMSHQCLKFMHISYNTSVLKLC